MDTIIPVVACFGEVLWDIFPQGKKAGGAPFNVSYNLKKQGIDSHMISRVGNDELGTILLQQLTDWNIPTTDCEVDDQLPTGTVLASIDEHNEAHYEIKTDVAWDNIQWNSSNDALAGTADAFVYGSLAARGQQSRDALYKLLEVARYRVFDINLRPPFYTKELLTYLLGKADLVKTNKAELREILGLFGKQYISEEDSMVYLTEYFDVKEVLLTKGSRGAVYYGNGKFCSCGAIPVTVNDTVGSGDSFLAGYLAARLPGGSVEDSLLNAAAMGAFITTQTGACPPYELADFEAFKRDNLHFIVAQKP